MITKIFCAAIVLLSCWLIYLSNENRRMHRGLEAALAGLEASSTSCVLPAGVSATAGRSVVELSFPRRRPALLLSVRKDCVYCESALRQWRALLPQLPNVEGLIYDGQSSYSRTTLEANGVDPNAVLVTPLTTPPYPELLGPTPTLLLIGRSGRVLGRWTGELSDRQAAAVRAAIRTILM